MPATWSLVLRLGLPRFSKLDSESQEGMFVLWPYLQYKDVPRLGVKLELRLQVDARFKLMNLRATLQLAVMLDP